MDRKTILSNLIWKYLERFAGQVVGFIISIILARILVPEQYGTLALVMVFIQIANVFVESGFNTALIQKKEADDVDFSSVLFLSLGVALVLYIVIFFSSPFIAYFYNQPNLIKMFRVLSLTLFIGAFNTIQNAFVAKHMLFKKLFASSLGAVTISGFVGIVAAYSGLGVWALVAQHLTSQLAITVILWFTVKWRPRLIFSFTRIKTLFSYGSKLLASSVLDTLYMNLRTLVIGRMYTPSMLGFYNRGEQFPKLIVNNINGSIQSVILPTLSAHQDNKKRVKEMMRRAIVTSSFLIFPMMIGMAVVAEPLVKFVLTDKWLPAVPFLQISCVSFALMPIHTANLQAINAIGRSDIFLKLEIAKKIIGLIILAVSLPLGVYAIAIGQVVNSIISSFINAYPNKVLLDYSLNEQLRDVMPSLIISLIMGGCVFLLNFLDFLAWQTLLIQVVSGGIIYIGLGKVFKMESYSYLVGTIKQLIKTRRTSEN